jgi:glyoxylase-like metal-dependent hydrolase (beta-lactamase superfamily II)
MQPIASGQSYVDLHFARRPRAVAAAVLHGPGGVALLDPGPTSTLPTLKHHLAQAGIRIADVDTILLTHIHLDHAGATGTIIRENPAIRVHVHDVGAPHLSNPSRLIASATRLYGEQMDQLWGEIVPVPPEAIVPLSGGERLVVAGRTVHAAATPGHASHHVSFWSPDTGVAFVGDTAGVMVVPGGFILPPTPPPDIDVERWKESLSVIEAWRPETLFLTHFGPAVQAPTHLAELSAHLDLMAQLAQRSLSQAGGDAEQEAWFVDQVKLELRRRLSDAEVSAYEASARFDLNWRGLARYWRKKSPT